MNTANDEPVFGEGLSSSLLRVINEMDEIDWLRDILRGFSHRCRNSLNGMSLGFYLCRKESSEELPQIWTDLERTHKLIEMTIDRLQAVYRPMNLTLVRSDLGSMIAECEASWRASFEGRGKTLMIEHPPRETPGYFDPMHLGQGLDALVAWRADACPIGTGVKISWSAHEEQFHLDWDEEAPRSTRPQPSSLERPSHELDGLRIQADTLALPLLARILRAHRGKLLNSQGSMLSLRMSWPLT